MMSMVRTPTVSVLLVLLSTASAFHLLGVSPTEYGEGQNMRIKVNSLTSTRHPIPYDYYSLPFCMPGDKNPKAHAENFGEQLWGDSIKPSLYAVEMQRNVTCRRLCTPRVYSKHQLDQFANRIELGYRGNMILDGLPVTEVFSPRPNARTYALGYPLGTPKTKEPGKGGKGLLSRLPFLKKKASKTSPLPPQFNIPNTLLNNHLEFTVKYHKPLDYLSAEKGNRIVGFQVVAYSVDHMASGGTCYPDDERNKGWVPIGKPPLQLDGTNITVVWSYSVNWLEDNEVEWGTRWDWLLHQSKSDSRIHWFSVTNSVLIILFLTGVVAMIFIRSLRKDLARYNAVDDDDLQEEYGWKLVHGDVFRIPPYANYLAIYTGYGCQLIILVAVMLAIAAVGYITPAHRGRLLTTILLLFVFLGSFGGYVTARLLRQFGCSSWSNITLAATLLPGHVFGVFFIMNLILWGKSASTAVPLVTLILLVTLWVFVSVPLVFVGAVIGYKKPVAEFPVRVAPNPRPIPNQPIYLKGPIVVLAAGILPFGAAFIELFFILSSIWLNRYYYLFGFLGLVFVILLVTCAEISIVVIYFQLCYEDWRWWWRAFFVTASSGIHLYLYSIFYYFTSLKITKFWATMVYFAWMAVASYVFAIMTGTIGFLASYFFLRYIYSAIKVE